MSLSRVDLPEPFTPIRPVRPGPKAVFRPASTGAPSGQLKLRSEQTIAAVMRRGSQHVGMIPVRVATPRRVGGRAHGLKRRSRATSAVSLTSPPQRTLPTADNRDVCHDNPDALLAPTPFSVALIHGEAGSGGSDAWRGSPRRNLLRVSFRRALTVASSHRASCNPMPGT